LAGAGGAVLASLFVAVGDSVAAAAAAAFTSAFFCSFSFFILASYAN
jgi:hypothetical protein